MAVIDKVADGIGIAHDIYKIHKEGATPENVVQLTADVALSLIPVPGNIGFAKVTADVVDTGVRRIVGKSTAEMAADLQKQIGKNRVSVQTPTHKIDIDLAGKPHHDKATSTDIPTPHVQTGKKNVSPDGKVNLSKKTIRPATKQDVRIAREILRRRGDIEK